MASKSITPKAIGSGKMVRLEGGEFLMGSDRHYPEEAPAHLVAVDDFWIDVSPVTNRQFAAFVDATGYRTFAETPPDPLDYPGIRPEMIQPGSLVFQSPGRPVSLEDITQWWSFCIGADWQRPFGPGSNLSALDDHPVVHIAYADAEAYAAWACKALPTEAEWEFACRGGYDGMAYAWGEELAPGGRILANYWQGEFPWRNTTRNGYPFTSPVGAYPPNGFGLYDMIGNVWEWTCDWYSSARKRQVACCMQQNPRGAEEAESYDPSMPHISIGRKVMKGGSHLCAPNYCRRYRPAARFAQPVDTSTSHIGFRCVVREPREPNIGRIQVSE